ncbi:hypothetical protein FB451DRAFT_1389284 [Mycena latifolia]|nr:hypothetical protein FB451DRAFT_1389284 [Mycena latifolia]
MAPMVSRRSPLHLPPPSPAGLAASPALPAVGRAPTRAGRACSSRRRRLPASTLRPRTNSRGERVRCTSHRQPPSRAARRARACGRATRWRAPGPGRRGSDGRAMDKVEGFYRECLPRFFIYAHPLYILYPFLPPPLPFRSARRFSLHTSIIMRIYAIPPSFPIDLHSPSTPSELVIHVCATSRPPPSALLPTFPPIPNPAPPAFLVTFSFPSSPFVPACSSPSSLPTSVRVRCISCLLSSNECVFNKPEMPELKV